MRSNGSGVRLVSRPLIFISHKHSDRAIATVVRSFITEQTRSKVPVFQSSDPTAMTPGVGRTLNVALRKALWDAGAVILIYTAPDQDWGYCMWECGVALLPESPDTRIILFQCGDTAPSLFDGQLGIDARNKTSVETFVTQFMTDVDFLPRAAEALTGYHKAAKEVQQAANKLFDDLQAVLPEGPVAEWPAHPYLQLQLPNGSAKAIADAPVEDRQAVARKVVLADTIVTESDKYCHALFGMAEFDRRLTLQNLYDTWRAAYPKSPDAWIDGLADQLGRAAQWQFPTLKWTAMPTVGEGRLYAAVLTRVRKIPSLGSLQFDVYFYPFNLLDATPVQSRMVTRADMLCRVLVPGGEGQVNVLDLLRELDDQRFSRLPFVDPDDRLVYIAHRSMLDQFISRQARTRNVSNLAQLTLADMFVEQPEIKLMFCGTAAFVSSEGTLADAKLSMNSVRNCYDVFVTETGTPQERVLGWLTDVTIAACEPG
jgi:hypothetical protein